MADDKRLIILKRLTEVLQGITIANGYQHDLADKVYRGRTMFDPQNDPVPLVTLFERGDVEEQSNNLSERNLERQEDWGLVLQGFVEADKDNPTDPAYPLMADCKKCLATVGREGHANYQLKNEVYTNRLISSIDLSRGLVLTPQKNSPGHVQFILFFTVDIVEDVSNPYRLNFN